MNGPSSQRGGQHSSKRDSDPTVALPAHERALNRDEIIDHLACVESYLPDGRRFELVVVGGAPLVLLGLRGPGGMTGDIDSAFELDPELVEAVARAGGDRGLSATWINARSRGFVPSRLRVGDVVYRSPKLVVRSAHADDIFIMKLYSAGSGGRLERDSGDLIALWSRCSYSTPREAVDDYLRRIPMADDNDPHLEAWIADLARQAENQRRVPPGD